MKFIRIDHVVAVESGESEEKGVIRLHQFKSVPAYLLLNETTRMVIKDAAGMQFQDERLARAELKSVVFYDGQVYCSREKPGDLRTKIQRQLGDG